MADKTAVKQTCLYENHKYILIFVIYSKRNTGTMERLTVKRNVENIKLRRRTLMGLTEQTTIPSWH